MPKKFTVRTTLKFWLLGAFIFSSFSAFAQDNSGSGTQPSTGTLITGYSKDYVMFQVTYDGLAGTLPDSLHTKGIPRGFNLDFMYDFKLDKTKPNSNYSLGVGLGISTSALFLNQTIGITDSTSRVLFHGNSPYKFYKLATTFIEIPVELRYRQFPDDANKGFKVAVGLKLGALWSVHTKGKLLSNGYNEIVKLYSKRFFNPYRAAATARIGWGNFALYGSYDLTGLFKQNLGPSIYPFSIGLCISGM